MGAIKNYFKQQFQTQKFGLNYEWSTDFYTTPFQKGASPLPLLCIRTILFLGCLAILITSIVLQTIEISGASWPIYLTSWGLVLITLASGLGFVVSVTAYYKGHIDDTLGPPWYIKVYWVMYAITIPLAFFITVFYWIFLSNGNEEFAPNFVLDIFIHAINSVLMFILLLTARQPTNLLHFYFPIVFAIIYVIFSAIYYGAGGQDPFGNNFIYPVLNWEEPGPSMIIVVIAAVMILILHIITAVLSSCRDAFGELFRKDNKSNFQLST